MKIAIGQPRIWCEFIESFHAVQNDKPNHTDTCRLHTSVTLSMDESLALNGNIAGESVTLLLSIRARVCTARSRLYVPPTRVSDVPLCVHSTPSTEMGS